jgi:hypothetical protein
MPTVEQRLDRLRRRRDWLALRIPQQTVVPYYDKSEHSALCWVIRFVEEHYVPEPQMERNPSNPCRAGSRDFQESSKVEVPKAPKVPRLIPTVPHGTAR